MVKRRAILQEYFGRDILGRMLGIIIGSAANQAFSPLTFSRPKVRGDI